jgi:hypothetical protein
MYFVRNRMDQLGRTISCILEQARHTMLAMQIWWNPIRSLDEVDQADDILEGQEFETTDVWLVVENKIRNQIIYCSHSLTRQ